VIAARVSAGTSIDRRANSAIAIAAAAACSDEPCDAVAGRCIEVHVSAPSFGKIDELELDVLYGDHHATTITGPGTGTVALPITTAIGIDVVGPGLLRVGVVAAGKLEGIVLGTGAAGVVIGADAKASITIELAPTMPCTPGTLYCGGNTLAGEPDTLYRCNTDGVPSARGVCTAGCDQRPGDDVCLAAGGTCFETGEYCGGDKVVGDPSTLYRCVSMVGVVLRECVNGCIVHPEGDDDYCRP
jgi:hypothetical protein